MRDISKLMRLGLFVVLIILIFLLGYFFLVGGNREAARQTDRTQDEAGENSTTEGIGVVDQIDPGGMVGEGDTPPPPESVTQQEEIAETPTQPPSARAALYEEAELERLRRTLAVTVP